MKKSIKEVFLFETDEEDELAALIAAQDAEMKAGDKVKDTEKSRLKKADPSSSFEPQARVKASDIPSASTTTGDASAKQEPKKTEPEKQDWFQRFKPNDDRFRIDVDLSEIPPEDHDIIKGTEEELNKLAKYKLYGDMAKIINKIRESDPVAHQAIMQAVLKSPLGRQGSLLATIKGKKHGGTGKKGNRWGRSGLAGHNARLDAAFGLDKKEEN